MAVVTPLNNPGGPEGDTVTADKQLPKYQSTPAGCALGSVGNPFDRVCPQPLLVTYNLSSLALTPGEPTPYVCMSHLNTV